MNRQHVGQKPADTTRIVLKEGWEVCYWTHELDVSEEELARAMRQVGNHVESVRGYFRNLGSTGAVPLDPGGRAEGGRGKEPSH